jgi:hypothetical protein
MVMLRHGMQISESAGGIARTTKNVLTNNRHSYKADELETSKHDGDVSPNEKKPGEVAATVIKGEPMATEV